MHVINLLLKIGLVNFFLVRRARIRTCDSHSTTVLQTASFGHLDTTALQRH